MNEPEYYCPIIYEQNYVDKVPHIAPPGIRCPCNNGKIYLYKTRTQFSAHVKTKLHKSWIQSLNLLL
jgi:hypothetical protein